MLKDQLSSVIKNMCNKNPTKGQEELISNISDFIVSSGDKDIFLLKGYAGTGKTTTISAMVQALEELKIRTILLAPTGRAAKVLSMYTHQIAYTIHKQIYRQKSSKDGFGNFMLDKNMYSNTFFVIDEASMIANQSIDKSVFGTGQLLNDLLEYVYNGKHCKIILIGDTAQLPPVGNPVGPALDKSYFEGLRYTVTEIELTEVVRQTENSGILYNATLIRNIIAAKSIEYPKFKLDGFSDMQRLGGADLIEELNSAYEKYGLNQTIVICRSNKRANLYNAGIRSQILWREEQLAVGDYLMIVKNNYFWLHDFEAVDFIANGDIAKVTRIFRYHDKYDYHFVDVSLEFIDYENIEIDARILLDTLTLETASLKSEDNKKMFYTILEDYAEIKPKEQQYLKVRSNKFFNALQVKYAYAVTCHKAQGGQWKAVFIDQGYFTDEMLNIDYLRWLYTALTRSTEKVYLVNFNDPFFEDGKMETHFS